MPGFPIAPKPQVSKRKVGETVPAVKPGDWWKTHTPSTHESMKTVNPKRRSGLAKQLSRGAKKR
jgi:hypothetical protein